MTSCGNGERGETEFSGSAYLEELRRRERDLLRELHWVQRQLRFVGEGLAATQRDLMGAPRAT